MEMPTPITAIPNANTNIKSSTIFKTGVPTALQSCMISLGTLSVQRLINSFGTQAVAAYTASTKIDSVAIMVVVTMGMSLAVYSGQNMGAGKVDRIKSGLYKTLALVLTYCVIMAVVMIFFGNNLLRIFLDASEAGEAVSIGTQYLRIIGIAYFMAGIMRCYLNVVHGTGDVNISMLTGLAELAFRIIASYILVKPLGLTGLWIAIPISWGCGSLIPVIRYYSGKKIAQQFIIPQYCDSMEVYMKHRKLLLTGCCLGVACVLLAAALFLWHGRWQPLNDGSVTVCSTSNSSSESQSAASSTAEAQYMEEQVGWLTVEGTEIDNAVMQAGDNDYYLRRNEYGEDDVWGCYFMDYACSPSSLNLVIYGHSLDDSTEAQRFSQLKRFSDPEWAAQHHTIQLEYNGQNITYEVISAGLANATTDTIAIVTNPGMEQARQIIDAALERSDVQFAAGKSADPLSRILTLATCTTDSGTRYVVTAIQISGDDTNAAD